MGREVFHPGRDRFISIVLYVSMLQIILDTMFGLPDITVISVGGVVLVVIAALALLGTYIPGA